MISSFSSGHHPVRSAMRKRDQKKGRKCQCASLFWSLITILDNVAFLGCKVKCAHLLVLCSITGREGGHVPLIRRLEKRNIRNKQTELMLILTGMPVWFRIVGAPYALALITHWRRSEVAPLLQLFLLSTMCPPGTFQGV